MNVLLYLRRLDLQSGAGQLVRMQANGLKKAGARVRIRCRHGAIKFFLGSGLPVKPVSKSGVRALNDVRDHIIVDNGMQLSRANVSFVHSLMTEAIAYLQRDDLDGEVEREAAYFGELSADTTIVANSNLVKEALVKHFGLTAQRIVVHHPGFRSQVFASQRAAELRGRAREALQIGASTPVVGFVTSGDFHMRGLDLFLASAEQIAAARPEVRFLVVGSRRLPAWAASHPLIASGRLAYRPKNRRPEFWMAALDIFLYAARFEAFGMVISEAQALGIPVVTSRRVGAAECLPEAYARWLLDAPDSAELAAKTLALLGDEQARVDLAQAGIDSVRKLDQQHYMDATVGTILAQNRRVR